MIPKKLLKESMMHICTGFGMSGIPVDGFVGEICKYCDKKQISENYALKNGIEIPNYIKEEWKEEIEELKCQ